MGCNCYSATTTPARNLTSYGGGLHNYRSTRRVPTKVLPQQKKKGEVSKNSNCPETVQYNCEFPKEGNHPIVDITIHRGADFFQSLCYTYPNDLQVSCITGGARAQVKFQREHEILPGEKIKLFNHRNLSRLSLNGYHTVEEVVDPRTVILDAGYLGVEHEPYTTLPQLEGCAETCLPEAKIMIPLTGKRFHGKITTRSPGENTHNGVGSQVYEGSNFVRVPRDLITVGDEVTIGGGSGINSAKVLRVEPQDEFSDFLTLDQFSLVDSHCAPLASDVGCLAEFGVDESHLDCGCVNLFLTKDITERLPLVGEQDRNCCRGTYRIGIYTIFCDFASTYSACSRVVVQEGCVYLKTTANPIKENTLALEAC